MRGLKRNPWLFGLGLLAIPVWFGGQASAGVYNDQAGSLIIFPKVIADGQRDTVIKITNTHNMPSFAHCFYTNALGTCSEDSETRCTNDSQCPGVLEGEVCENDWEVRNFDIFLTGQQPTFWRVSTGRFAALLEPSCTMGNPCSCTVAASGALACPGFDPGREVGIGPANAIAPIGEDFAGELRCYQTESDGKKPYGQNSLIGEAIIETLDSGQISTYDAVQITATNPGDAFDLLLDGNAYNACPEQLIFAHRAEDTATNILGRSIQYNTELTLVPCSALYETGTPVTARVDIYTWDEFESMNSLHGVEVNCFSNERLNALPEYAAIFGSFPQNSSLKKTRIVVQSDNICLTGDNAGDPCTSNAQCPGHAVTAGGISLGCRPSPGVVGVVEEFYGGEVEFAGHAAWSLTQSGTRTAADIIVVPELQ